LNRLLACARCHRVSTLVSGVLLETNERNLYIKRITRISVTAVVAFEIISAGCPPVTVKKHAIESVAVHSKRYPLSMLMPKTKHVSAKTIVITEPTTRNSFMDINGLLLLLEFKFFL